jgi:hypothetical protein
MSGRFSCPFCAPALHGLDSRIRPTRPARSCPASPRPGERSLSATRWSHRILLREVGKGRIAEQRPREIAIRG